MIKRVEINYRGVYQKTLARRIGGDVVLISTRMGKVAFSNGRYSDAPERNGIPCKYFAFVSGELSEAELEADCGAKMDVDSVDVSVVLDDTLLKGVEPWGWSGIRPINEKVTAGSCLLVVSRRGHDELASFLAKRSFPYRMAVLDGDASFSGMWVFRDDLTRERVLGAIAAVDPGVISIDAVCDYLLETTKEERRANAAREANAAALQTVGPVASDMGIDWPHTVPSLPAWQEFDEGVVVRAVPRRSATGQRGQARNPGFQHGTSKTERPVVRFDTCIKCTLCWLACPEGCFDPVDGGYYDVDYDYCTGCSKCAAICPVAGCISMVNELRFTDNRSPWLDYQADPSAYIAWVESKTSEGLAAYDYIPGAIPAGSRGAKASAKPQD